MRDTEATPYVDHDDAIVMIGSSVAMRAACLDAAVKLGARSIQTTHDRAGRVVATARPLVIVVDEMVQLSTEEQTDMSIGVGAQLVVARPHEQPAELAERVKLAVKAARVLRNRAGSDT